MHESSAVDGSPFHEGERRVQERLGVRDRIEAFAHKVIRDHMPEQHRQFYGRLPLIFLGTVDRKGRPWASMLTGQPGFMNSPDARTLDIAARPMAGDPLHETLAVDADIGLLGLEFHTRRRNRLSGRVSSVRPDGFRIAVRQAFGNCPRFIQSRTLEHADVADADDEIHRTNGFDRSAQRIIEEADTFFIATAWPAEGDSAAHGTDVSHRGGRPGFVRVEDEHSFVFPDFSGNNHFNTIGNLLLNPKAGFLFVDFETGERLYMTGSTEIVWQGDEVDDFEGAERFVRFRVDEGIRVKGDLPLRFRFGDYSPFLAKTGDWRTAEGAVKAMQGSPQPRCMRGL